MIKTSNLWMKEPKYLGLLILDPDGWNRRNFNYSYYEEEIDEAEFNKRLSYSTVVFYEG